MYRQEELLHAHYTYKHLVFLDHNVYSGNLIIDVHTVYFVKGLYVAAQIMK